MMDPFGIARDFRADDASRVGIVRRAAHAADRALIEHLDFKRAGRRTIVRTGGIAGPDGVRRLADGLIHGVCPAYPNGRLLSSEEAFRNAEGSALAKIRQLPAL